VSNTRLLSMVMVASLSLALACSKGSGPGKGGGAGSGSGGAGSGGGTTIDSGGVPGTGGAGTGGVTAAAGSGGATGGGGSGGSSSATVQSGGSGPGGQGGVATSSAGSGGSRAGGGGGSSGSGGAGGKSGSAGSPGFDAGGPGSGGTGPVDGGAGRTGTGGAGGSNGGGTDTGAGTGGTTGPRPDAAVATDGGGNTSLVTPTKVSGSNKYRFTAGDLVLEVDQDIGARVDTLSLGGTNLVQTPVSDLTQWGSTFWTSPRSDWKPSTWPPPASIDANPYTGGISDNHLIVSSATDATMGFSISKDYSLDSASGWIHITYTINATKALKAAPWEDTRVPRGGLAFFPAGTSLTKGPLTMTTSSGIVWFDDASKSATSSSGSKATADGSGGWSAYAISGVLFLKKFTDTTASAQVPNEGEIAIYPGTGFLEIEVQGPYTSIAANESLPWSIQWRAVKIPSSVTVAAGSSTLAAFAEQQAAL
jgi:hypothetical protein